MPNKRGEEEIAFSPLIYYILVAVVIFVILSIIFGKKLLSIS
jgi:hypothetical protein